VLFLILLHSAYWHDGFFLGPRFFFLAVPLLCLQTVRGIEALRLMFRSNGLALNTVSWAGVSCLAIALSIRIPARFSQYADGLPQMRVDHTAPARAAGIGNSLILVRESWGAQLVPRLWALGVSRSATEALYRGVDTCILDEAIRELEESGTKPGKAQLRLRNLLRDSSRVVASTLSPDASERVLPGSRYSSTCARRIAEDRSGFTVFAPVLSRDWGSNIYARDLHARDSVLLQQFPDRPIYLLTASDASSRAQLSLMRVNRDSMIAEWRETVR
jgi:hypothetical protein